MWGVRVIVVKGVQQGQLLHAGRAGRVVGSPGRRISPMNFTVEGGQAFPAPTRPSPTPTVKEPAQ